MPPSPTADVASSLTRLTFTTADGTEYELRDQLTDGRGFATKCHTTGSSRGRVFVTRDGTAATFVSDTEVTETTGYLELMSVVLTPSGDLRLRDGTRYRIDRGLVTWMQDRNGNRLNFTYSDGALIRVADSLNRVVTITYNVNDGEQYGVCDRITYSGSGSGLRTIRVSKTTLGNTLHIWSIIANIPATFPTIV